MTKKSEAKKKKKKSQKPFHIIIILILVIVAALVIFNEYNYRGVHKSIALELGSSIPEATAFAKNKDTKEDIQYVTDISTISIKKEGTYKITVKVGKRELDVKFKVKDTVAPTADKKIVTIGTKDTITPDKLVENVTDAGLVSISWKKAPDFGVIGDYNVFLTLKDEAGNKTKINTTVKIRDVYDELEIEANSDGTVPEANDYFLFDTTEAEYVGNLSNVKTDKPGIYPVTLVINGKEYSSKIKVTDTTPPVVTTSAKVILKDSAAPDALSFIESVTELTGAVTAVYETPIDTTTAGEKSGKIVVSDSSGNKTVVSITYIVSEFESVTIEADELPIIPEKIIKNYHLYNSVNLIDGNLHPETLGACELVFDVDGSRLSVYVTVTDTKVPVAEPNPVKSYACYPLEADLFVKNIQDGSKVTCSFQQKPDWTKAGTQNVVILLTDEAGNKNTVTTTVTLEKDSTPPVITGLLDRFTYLDEAVAYLKEIRATDNVDKNVNIQVVSDLNIHKLGKYNVTFIATDMAGNTTKASTTFTVIESTVTDEDIKELANKVLYGSDGTAGIINDTMTTAEKASAIFDWCNKKIKYVGDNNHSDWRLAAKRGFEKKSGDCYTFYAVSRALLEQLDNVQLLEIRRYREASTRHYWLLVNIMNTGWYHFDTCNLGPWISPDQTGPRYRCFMEIDSNLVKYSGRYWRYDDIYPNRNKEDENLYPDIATKEFIDPEK
ncbi:MAG: Ig-like domain repeat protein [Clostridia bacterium]|nr:Ig-like domain repeat protein [Clostridia bacterium]